MRSTQPCPAPDARTTLHRRVWVSACTCLVVALLLAPLLACGKRGAPSPPGPPSQITYPKTYPTQ